MDGTVLVVGLPDAGYGGRSVRVFLADQTGTFTERLNVTAPNNGPGGSRFGAQVILSASPAHAAQPLPVYITNPCTCAYGEVSGTVHIIPCRHQAAQL